MLGTIIFLKNFNNYYNRELKKFDSLTDYAEYMVGSLPNVNFNPNDGVNTKVDQLIDTPSADYLLYTENDVIISRWFILESQRKTSGFWELTLRRDVLADNWQTVLTAPMFVEKATVNDNSSLIYNDEPFTCNQVKVLEAKIYDETNTAWIVGYLARNYNDDGNAQAFTFDAEVIPDYSATSLEAWDKYNLLNTTWRQEGATEFRFKASMYSGPGNLYVATVVIGENDIKVINQHRAVTEDVFAVSNSKNFGNLVDALKAVPDLYSTLKNYRNLYVTNISQYNTTNYDMVTELIGKTLKTSDKPLEYYSLGAARSNGATSYYDITEDKATGYLLTYLTNVINGITGWNAVNNAAPDIAIGYNSVLGSAELSQQGQYSVLFQKDRYHLKDGPYDMFIMPYGSVTLKNGDDFSVECDRRSAMSIAQGIAQNMNAFLYDIQILPYCPATGFIITEDNGHTTININNTNAKRISKIYGSNNTDVRGAVIWCTASSGSKYIPFEFRGITNKKLFNCCVKFRLSAGNYGAGFDFSPVKNGGVEGMNVDFTYIPYNPYIRVAPVFGGLYGKDFKDARGLIIQGDHSITYLNDKWIEYQVNNKNYLNAFNRQMENMDVQRTAERWSQAVGATVGAVGAGVQAGSVFGVGVGIAGAGLSAAGGIADYAISERLYDENKRYAKDQFRYSLENVQALPNTLAKVVAYTPNNKIVPVLEVYYGTAEDNQAFCDMIRYQGMTVGIIGRIQDYIDNSWEFGGIKDKGFVKGRPIQLKDLSEDYHMATAIADEIGLGIYTKDN